MNNTFSSFTNKNKTHFRKSATSLTSAMTILCSIIMCFRSWSCSATGTCSSQKIHGTGEGPSRVAGPPGPPGSDSGSRMQSLLSGERRGNREEVRPTLFSRAISAQKGPGAISVSTERTAGAGVPRGTPLVGAAVRAFLLDAGRGPRLPGPLGGRLQRWVGVPRPRRGLRLSSVTLWEGHSLRRGSR